MKSEFILLLFLILLSPIQIQSQETLLGVTTDRQSYKPEDTVLFVVSGNSDIPGILQIYYKESLLDIYKFENLTIEPFLVLWEIKGHSSNGTYQAIVNFEDDTEYISEVNFDIIRDDVGPSNPTAWKFLYLNITAHHENTDLLFFDVTITNLATNETMKYEEIDTRLEITIDTNIDDLIRIRSGHAILLEIETVDHRYKGSTIFAARLDENEYSLDLDKKRDPDYLVRIAFAILVLVIIIFIVIHTRRIIADRTKALQNQPDPHKPVDVSDIMDSR